MKGHTRTPLRICIHPSFAKWEEMDALRAQGHTVTVWLEAGNYDLVLAPNAWRMLEGLRADLKTSVAAAQRQRSKEEL